LALVQEAGYYVDSKTGILTNADGEKLKFTFTVAGETEDHPAYQTMVKAAEVLNSIGFDVTVTKDSLALSKLASGQLEVWAAAWSSSIDPDMYQVYHKESTASSVKNWGYPHLLREGTVEEQDILDRLAEQIELGRKYLEDDARKPYYAAALDLVMDLAVELPTYQRKDLVVWNKTVIDSATLNLTPSSTSGLVDRLWEINFVNENSGKVPAGNNDNGGVIIGIIIGAVLVIGGAAGAFVFLKLRKKPQTYVLDESSDENEETSDSTVETEKTESDESEK
jgi:peptide/nickel transport system substrate-binding protein